MNIKKSIADFQNLLEKQSCKLVAVSKKKSEKDILEAYDAGQRIFGENRAQELEQKYHQLPKDIQWHMIGHLQTNKVKYIASFVSMIESVDSLKLCKEINKQAQKCERNIDILLQIHIGKEESKFGFSPDELMSLIQANAFSEFQNISVRGVMGMATLTDDESIIRNEFKNLRKYFQDIASLGVFPEFTEISMGMTSDYKIAIEEGSTMIRVGSAIFGARE